ncbi:MAG: MurR/RpiR family transcriptional regulator [Oscillospiraceae bacterium]
MKHEDVMDTLTAKYMQLTKAGKKVADYIFANREEAQFLSITALAEECNVAEATVFRFCKTLGYSGYNDFKLGLATAHGAATGSNNEYGLYGKISVDDSIGEMCRKLYSTNVSSITQTLELINDADIIRAVDYLYKAKRIYCFGQGGSMVLAMEAWARFLTAAPNFYCIEDAHLQAMSASLLDKDDVVMFFTYSGATKDMLDVLRPAKERGAKIIVFSHFKKSPASAYADIMLLCGSKEGPLQSGSVAAKMGILFLIDVLFNEYCRRAPELCLQNKELTTNSIADKLL